MYKKRKEKSNYDKNLKSSDNNNTKVILKSFSLKHQH